MVQLALIPKQTRFRFVFWNPRLQRVKWFDFWADDTKQADKACENYANGWHVEPLVLKFQP